MAGEYIEFNNATQPAINDTNLNRLQQLIKQDIVGQIGGDTLPIGSIVKYGSNTIPNNWLLCNGQAISRTTYSDLFTIIGTAYGTGDGFTTFNVPNLIEQQATVQNYIIKASQSSGVVATVVDNLISTSTTNALSANQGKVLNDKFSRHIITANVTQTTSTAGVDTILTLNELVKVGNKLSVSNGKVVIGDGVSKVKVSAKALIDTPQLANSFFFIRKNNSNIISGDNYGIYVSISITDYLVSVQQGDSFSLLINTGLDANIYNGTYLTIEVVE